MTEDDLRFPADVGGAESPDSSFNSPDGYFGAFDVEAFLLLLEEPLEYYTLNPTLTQGSAWQGTASFYSRNWQVLEERGITFTANTPPAPPPITLSLPTKGHLSIDPIRGLASQSLP